LPYSSSATWRIEINCAFPGQKLCVAVLVNDIYCWSLVFSCALLIINGNRKLTLESIVLPATVCCLLSADCLIFLFRQIFLCSCFPTSTFPASVCLVHVEAQMTHCVASPTAPVIHFTIRKFAKFFPVLMQRQCSNSCYGFTLGLLQAKVVNVNLRTSLSASLYAIYHEPCTSVLYRKIWGHCFLLWNYALSDWGRAVRWILFIKETDNAI